MADLFKHICLAWLVIMGSSGKLYSQNDSLSILYAQKNYAAAKRIAENNIQHNINLPLSYLVLGRVLVETGRFDSSVRYLSKAVDVDNERSYVSSWAYGYIGRAYYELGDNKRSFENLNYAIKTKPTSNSTKYAQYYLGLLCGKDSSYCNSGGKEPAWFSLESTNILYYFQGNLSDSFLYKRFAEKHQRIYDTLNTIFHDNLSGKIKMYVFTDEAKAKRLLHRDLGFAVPEKLICYVAINQTPGHELTHIMSYWAGGTPPEEISKFINEGVSVFFDFSGRDNFAAATSAAKKYKYTKSILDIWNNFGSYPDELTYPAAGAFIAYIYNILNPEEFKSLLKKQTVGQLKKILSRRFSTVIDSFNKEIGINNL